MAKSLSLENPVVQLVEDMTAEAMDNMFDVEITFPDSIAAAQGLSQQAKYRCEAMTPPEPKAYSYDVEYKGHKIHRTASGIDLDHKFTLNFTIDAGYNLYTAFKAWNAICISPNNGGSTVGNTLLAGGKIKLIGLVGTVAAVSDWGSKEAKAEALEWEFQNVVITSVGEPQFKKGAKGSQLKYKVEFFFGKYSYPTMPKAGEMTA